MKDVEHVVLKNNLLQVEVIPELGAKISSIKILSSGTELLQAPLKPYAKRTHTMAFDEADASGFDECLPTVSGCEFKTPGGTVSVPDHGDFWRIPWTSAQSGNEVELKASGFSLPLEFSKKIRLEGDQLSIHYTVRNTSDSQVEFSWSAHPLFVVDPGDRVVLPASVKSVLVEGSKRLGPAGKKYAWPNAVRDNGATIDLSVCGTAQDGVADKLYATSPEDGWCALERRTLKTRIEVSFDPQESPFLGLWLCYGGWPSDSAHRQYCVALEPCMAPMDSLASASAKGYTRKLGAQQKYIWSIAIRVKAIEE